MGALSNYCQSLRRVFAPNHTSVAAESAAGRGAGEARPKGKYSRGRMALAPIRIRRIFPATEGTLQP